MLRPFEATDIFRFNSVNVDAWTATYHNGYYASYLAQWPDWCIAAEDGKGGVGAYSEYMEGRGGRWIVLCLPCYSLPCLPCLPHRTSLIVVIAKHEPPPPNPQHHGHLTAMSISPRMRGLGLARVFMSMLERLSSDGTAGWPPSKLGASSEGGEGKEEDKADRTEQGRTDCVDAFFVDLFVRCNNHRAIEMYEKLGYSVFRRVVE